MIHLSCNVKDKVDYKSLLLLSLLNSYLKINLVNRLTGGIRRLSSPDTLFTSRSSRILKVTISWQPYPPVTETTASGSCRTGAPGPLGGPSDTWRGEWNEEHCASQMCAIIERLRAFERRTRFHNVERKFPLVRPYFAYSTSLSFSRQKSNWQL